MAKEKHPTKELNILREWLLEDGIKGRVFVGIVGKKYREYSPLEVVYFHVSEERETMVDYNSRNIVTGIRVNLVGNDIPQTIMKRRKNGFPGIRGAGHYDCIRRLDYHLEDLYVRDLTEEDLAKWTETIRFPNPGDADF